MSKRKIGEDSPCNGNDDNQEHKDSLPNNSVISLAWNSYFTGIPNVGLEQSSTTPNYDEIYAKPLPRHEKKMLEMVKKSIDTAALNANGVEKAIYFFEGGCGTGRYRSVPQKAAQYAQEKGYNIKIVWIANDISEEGLRIYKDKLVKEGFKQEDGYNQPGDFINKDNLAFRFLKSNEKTTAKELEDMVGVVVENSFDVFGVYGYMLNKDYRCAMMEMRSRITRGEIFFTVPGPTYSKSTRQFAQKRMRGEEVGLATEDGDVEYSRGNLRIPFHTFTRESLQEEMERAHLSGEVMVSNTIHEKDGLMRNAALDREDELITAAVNQSGSKFLQDSLANYWEVTAKSTLKKDPETGKVINSFQERLRSRGREV